MKCDDAIKNRLKRTQGQIQGVLKMMDNETICSDLVNQLKAIRSSIDTTIGVLTTNNLIQMIESTHNVKLTHIDDALHLVIKGIK